MICWMLQERLAWRQHDALADAGGAAGVLEAGQASKATGMFGSLAGYFFRISLHSYTPAWAGMFRCLSFATMGSNCFLGNDRWSLIWATMIF